MSPTQSKPRAKKPQETLKTWSRLSVHDFFSQINWEHDPEPIQKVKQASLEGRSEKLSLTLSVSQFFTCIDWEGHGAIAPSAPLPLEESESPSTQAQDEVTLEDFSSLF
jgi:hypothetical protein